MQRVAKKLSELEPGERGIVAQVAGPDHLRRRLLDMGLVKGTEVAMVRKAPLGDPIEFLVRGYNLSLRREEADNVYVLVETRGGLGAGEGSAPAAAGEQRSGGS
jgi:Fe2+ transport system protein FeoA